MAVGKLMFKSHKAYSSIEILVTIAVILLAMISFRGYIQRALTGSWKNAGDTFGQTRQYDPRGFGTPAGASGGTKDCFMDRSKDRTQGNWIDEDCYRRSPCDCTFIRFDGEPLQEHESKCVRCKELCIDNGNCDR